MGLGVFCPIFRQVRQEVYPACRVSFDLPRKIEKRKETSLLPLPDSRKIEGDSASRVQEVRPNLRRRPLSSLPAAREALATGSDERRLYSQAKSGRA